MKLAQKIAWWGLKRAFFLTIIPAKNRFEGRLQFGNKLHQQVTCDSIEGLQQWMIAKGDYPVWIQFVLDEVAMGNVKAGQAAIETVLGVQVAQASLFWIQKYAVDSKQEAVAVIRKNRLEANLEPWKAFEKSMIGFSIFPDQQVISHVQKTALNQPNQLKRQRNTYKIVGWTNRLALAATCCSLIASLYFSLSSKQLALQVQTLEQQAAVYRPLLDSIQHNEDAITWHLAQVEQQKQLKPRAYSYFSDQIAAIASPGVQFDQLIFQPDRIYRQSKDPSLHNDSIARMLSGKAEEAAAIASFSQELASLTFIAEVRLLETPFDPREAAYFFRIIGKLKP